MDPKKSKKEKESKKKSIFSQREESTQSTSRQSGTSLGTIYEEGTSSSGQRSSSSIFSGTSTSKEETKSSFTKRSSPFEQYAFKRKRSYSESSASTADLFPKLTRQEEVRDLRKFSFTPYVPRSRAASQERTSADLKKEDKIMSTSIINLVMSQKKKESESKDKDKPGPSF
ncbi:hypothetical protein PGB90_009751 [Kerria lacca]